MVKTAVPIGGLTPPKLALIIVLSIIFLVVIVVQFGGGKPKRRTARTRNKASADTTAEAAPSREPAEDAEQPRERWPDYKLQDLLQHNPFSLPQELMPPAEPDFPLVPETSAAEISEVVPIEPRIRGLRRRQADLIASLKEQGVDMVLVTPRGRVARIGAATFREGDLVEGLVVQEISATGIVFIQEPTLGQP